MIKYGKGYRMKKTTILEYNFNQRAKNKEEKEEIRRALFDPKVDRYVELYDEPPSTTGLGAAGSDFMHENTSIDDVEKEVDFEPIPMVSDLSYFVKNSSRGDRGQL